MELEKNIGKTAVNAKPSVDLSGTWKNQLNSLVNFQMTKEGRLTGEYQTAVGKPSDNEKFELMGIVTGDLVSFIVNFGKYGSLTAWTGQITKENGKEVIKTVWHLSQNVKDEDEDEQIWGTVLTGCGNFVRVE